MTDVSETPPPARAASADRLKRLARILLFLLLLWVAFTYLAPRLSGKAPLPQPIEETRAPRMEPQPAPVPPPARDDADGRLAALEERVRQLEEAQHAAPLQNATVERLPQIEAAIAELKRTTDDRARRLAAMTAFSQLKDAIARGENYYAPLTRLAGLLQGQGDAGALIAKLSPQAKQGLITLAELQSRFEAAIPQALAPQAGSWSRKVRSLIQVRKVGGDQAGLDDESVIARAESKLDEGDVAAALRDLLQLSPPAADTLESWKTQAQQYTSAQESLAALEVAILGPTTETAAP